MPLTVEDLNKAGCGMPNCTHDHSVLYLHPRCHLSAGTRVRYEKKGRLLVIECWECGKEVARVKL